MTDRKTALLYLLDMATAETLCQGQSIDVVEAGAIRAAFPDLERACEWVSLAVDGSLDAAFALKAATVPHWAIDGITVWPGGMASVYMLETREFDGDRVRDSRDNVVSAQHKVLSVAMLIAIIRALIEDGK
jgi:hypothetical protein